MTEGFTWLYYPSSPYTTKLKGAKNARINKKNKPKEHKDACMACAISSWVNDGCDSVFPEPDIADVKI